MKLNELKCKNCGAKIKVPEKAETVTCDFCHTTFSVEDAYTEGYKYTKGILDAHDDKQKEQFERAKEFMNNNPVSKIGKIISIFIIMIVIFGLGIMVYSIIKDEKEYNKESEERDKKWEITKFNNQFLYYNGTKSGFFVKTYLDDIVDSNKQNKIHIVKVKFNDIETSDSNEIINMKKNIDEKKDYEVIVDYDSEGYFNLMTIVE